MRAKAFVAALLCLCAGSGVEHGNAETAATLALDPVEFVRQAGESGL